MLNDYLAKILAEPELLQSDKSAEPFLRGYVEAIAKAGSIETAIELAKLIRAKEQS